MNATQLTDSIERLVMRLEAIAKKNDDQFRYKIEIEPTRKGIKYLFVCEETADGHCLLTGYGPTFQAAIDDAEKGVEKACLNWNYEVK